MLEPLRVSKQSDDVRRSAAQGFAVSGADAVARWLVEFGGPSYYEPEALLDCAALVPQTVAHLTAGADLGRDADGYLSAT